MEYFILVITIIAVIVIAKLFSWPFKKILKLLFNILIGLLLILIVNSLGVKIGLHIPFNIVTAIISGTLGFPGVLCLIVLNYIF